jgi:hypothetical protein
MSFFSLEPIPAQAGRAGVIRFVCEAGGIDAALVSRIELHGSVTTFEVPDSREARLLGKTKVSRPPLMPLLRISAFTA